MQTLTAPPTTATRACPKCGNVAAISLLECPRCSVIIDKVGTERPAAAPQPQGHGWTGVLAAAEQLSIKQQVERLEAWTGIEGANAYVVKDGLGNVVFQVAEESGSVGDFLIRNFLKAQRPFTMRIQTPHGETALVLERPFRWFFGEVQIMDAMGRSLGSVQRQFSLFNAIYHLTGTDPTEKYEIFGPMWRPWTFKIRQGGSQCGLISKSWSGLGREMFTDADSFGIEFPPGVSPELKAAFLGAVFLIDFAHFEDNGGN